ncbi:MAG TPA: hypothetical protein VM165_10585, partial [Planctomycetaceae bacterium]|nr:hypothetical protein [Planctomycetaceae bacterium]
FDSLNNFAFLSARTGKNLPEAAEAIETALRMAGSRPDLQDTRAMVLIAQDRLAEARDLLEDMTAQHVNATALFRLAECYHRQQQSALASAALKLAVDKGLVATQLHPLDRAVLEELQAIAP